MTNFIIGAIFGIAALLLLTYIMSEIDDRRIKKELGEDYKMFIMTESEIKKYEKYMYDQQNKKD